MNNPEGFGKPEYNHPEAPEPLDTQPAEQVTLRHLMTNINNASGNVGIAVYVCEKDLRYPGSNAGNAVVARKEKGTSPQEPYQSGMKPDQIGQVQYIEFIGDKNDQFITEYSILDAPDGLQIEKQLRTSKPYKIIVESTGPVEKVWAEKTREIEEAVAIENETGLSFVSEQETRDVLRFLDDLER